MKRAILLHILLVSHFVLFAEPMTLALTTGVGARGRGIHEFAYKDDSMISRLDWSDTIAPLIGVSGSLKFHNVLLSLDVESALAVKTGKLEDYDFSSSDNSVITQYSRHDLYLDKDISFGIRIGYDFHFGDFSLLPCAGFIYRNVKYSAQDVFFNIRKAGYGILTEKRHMFRAP